MTMPILTALLPAFALAALDTPKVPDTMAALRKAMATDARKLTKYQDSWLLTTTTSDQKFVLRVVRSIDGVRGATAAFVDRTPIVSLGSDGKTSFFALHTQQVYAQTEGNPWQSRVLGGAGLPVEDGDFNFNFDGIYDFEISSKPELTLGGIEKSLFEGKPARMATCSVTRTGGDSGVVLKLWFPEDRFILLRAEATIKPKAGSPISFTAIREKAREDATYDADEFSLDQDLVDGFKRMEWSKLVPGFSK